MVELIGAGLVLVEPNGVAFALAKLVAVRVGYKRHRHSKYFVTCGLADQLNTGGDVAPLVGAGYLQINAARFVQILEIQALNEHIRELRIGDTALHLTADEIFAEHIANVDILTVVTEEINNGQIFHPIVVINNLVGEDPLQLCFEAFVVVNDLVAVRELALNGSTRVADKGGRHTNKEQGSVTCCCKTASDKERGVVTQVQAVSRGVSTNIKGHSACIELVHKLGAGNILNQTSPFEIFIKCHLSFLRTKKQFN